MQRRLHSLAVGLRAIPGTLNIDSLAHDLCLTASSITEATGAVIGTWDGQSGELLAVVGTDGGPRPGDTFAAPASELALAMLADTMIVRQSGDWSLGRTSVAHPGERWDTRPRAMAALPLRGAGDTVGVLAVWTSRAPALEPLGLDLLHALSPYAAMHLEHARSYGQVRDTADRDPLTLLRNRRAFDSAIGGERMRFERYGRPVSLLLMDIDHFKSINDRFGHEAGDEVLRRVAALLAASIRDVDTAARYGGEEFVVLLPETRLKAAVEVAERIRTAIAGTTVPYGGAAIRLSVSVGVSCCPERVSAPADLVGSADAALYQAKAAGRNRTVVATS
jgi:diguanylate cyclase (GGDEF)-like protein